MGTLREGAEGAVLGADVGVVDIAVDDVADDSVGMEAAADGVGFHADADQIIRAEQVESLRTGKAHTSFMIQVLAGQVSRFQQFGSEQRRVAG